MMIGLVTKCTLQHAHNFAQVDGRIQLFQIDDRVRNGCGIALALASSRLRPPIGESQHPFEDKAPRFVTHHGTLHPGLTTALRRRFSAEDNRPDDLVIVLDRINKLSPNVLELFLRRHESAPCGPPSMPVREGSPPVYRSVLSYSQLYAISEATFRPSAVRSRESALPPGVRPMTISPRAASVCRL